MIKREHVESDLPDLDHTNDPRGGAIAWALLVIGVALVTTIYLAAIWVAGVW